MKHYRIEPTHKKSVIEIATFRRPLEELTGNDEDKGRWGYLRKELGWRWGSFMISVPDTDEEIKEFLEERGGYDNLTQYFTDYQGEEDPSVIETATLQDYLLPGEDDDFVDLTDDYDAEMIDCWDGCWEDWGITVPGDDLENTEEMIEEIEEAYSEEYEEGVEALGWQFIDTFFEIQSSVTVTQCNRYGQVEVTDEVPG